MSKKQSNWITFEFENGITRRFPSQGYALQYAHEMNTRIIRQY